MSDHVDGVCDNQCIGYHSIVLVNSVDVRHEPDKPADMQAALSSVSAADWRQAIQAEFDAHHDNGTCDVVRAPLGQKLLGFKWVFTTTRDEQSRFIKRKARLVAQGFAQKAGRDYHLTEFSVTDCTSLCTFLAVAAARGLVVR